MTATQVRWPAQAGFNRAAADAVYKAMSEMDEDSALVFGRLLVLEGVRHDLARYGDEIAKRLDTNARERIRLLKKQTAHTALAKSRRGENNVPELARLASLSKAFNTEEYREPAGSPYGGRWARRYAESSRIAEVRGMRPLKDAHEKHQGIPKPADADNMTKEDRAAYQQAYMQIQDMVSPYRRKRPEEHMPLLHLHVQSPDGSVAEHQILIPTGDNDIPISDKVKAKERIVGAQVSTEREISPAGAAYDVLAAAGAPRAGGWAAQAMMPGAAGDVKGVQDYREALNEAAKDHTPAGRAFRRMGASSKLLSQTIGPNAPPSLQLALQVGQHMGQYGPEAQKVIGPFADRAAYRYRGTERSVDPKLARAVQQSTQGIGLPADATPEQRMAVLRARREALVHGMEDDKGIWHASRLHEYYGPGGAILPKADLNTLQRKSGVIPPSQGVIINAKGQLVTQAVGYGDDWYLPFNLKNLKALKGGEYVRTRTFGGLTTEDIYAGLISGARSMTVVSHSGVFTVEFDPTLRGGRRFNDKALAMTGRYGHLLDAVQSRDVTGPIHGSRNQELREAAALVADPVEDEDQFKKELERLRKKELLDPTLSEAQKDQAATMFLEDQADKMATRSGIEVDPRALINNIAEGQARKIRADIVAQGGPTPPSHEVIAQNQKVMWERLAEDSPQRAALEVARATGRERAYETWMKRAAEENKRSLTPLRLDANGYKLAQDALKEQFPYFIARTDFHQWDNAATEQDTGYVKPRHNRPAAALSGYYDTDIEPGVKYGGKEGDKGERASGKYHAHTTRYQNYPVHGGEVRFVEKPKVKEGEETKAGEGKKGKTGANADVLRADADKELLTWILDQDSFGPGAKIPVPGGGHNAVAGKNPHEEIQLEGFPNNEYKKLMDEGRTDRAALLAKLDDPVTRSVMNTRMKAAMSFVEGNKLYDIPKEMRENWRRGGQRPEMKKAPKDARTILAGLGDNFNWGPRYDTDARKTSQAIAETYAGPNKDPRAQVAGLPASLDADDWDATVGKVKERIETQYKNLSSYSQGPQAQAGLRKLDREAENLHRANQLHRMYGDALKAEQAERDINAVTPTPLPTPPEIVHEQHDELNIDPVALAGLDDAQYQRLLARMDELARRRRGNGGGNGSPAGLPPGGPIYEP